MPRKLGLSRTRAVALAPLFVAVAVRGQALHSIARLPDLDDPLAIRQLAVPNRPFSVIGERGAVLGSQAGEFEAWLFPVKILAGFRISAELEGYPVPIDINAQASSIQVSPSETVITYSHATCTVRQRMVGPRGAGVQNAALALFEIDAIRPLELTFRFTPAVERMWPASNFGPPGPEWVEREGRSYYLLHTNSPDLVAAVALPGAKAGILAPYQERPRTLPLEFRLRFNPATDKGTVIPLLMTVGKESDDLGARLVALNESALSDWRKTREYYRDFLAAHTVLDTPDQELNRALSWAPVAVEQGRVRFHDETALTAGFAPSGDSARPGFGWFFGRDALWSLYAVHSYGDFDLARAELEFLIRRQRNDGKIMHEYSQAADLVDWSATPYFYAAADATPLFVMAMEDYARATGDAAFLRRHWDSVKRAYAFTRAHDSDGDGVYENTEGTGWVEGWPPKMPHQEIYLAALDQQSAGAMSRLAVLMGDGELAQSAARSAQRIRSVILEKYYDPASRFYAFSRNPDGSIDRVATMFPAVAWWDGQFALDRAGPMLNRWASHEFSTDWGTRDVSAQEPFYDPISYHQGSVWPLFTAWVALAEYRAGRAASGYAHLAQNAALTFLQDLGSITELLSGDLFEPLGRSSAHQVWSSSMTFNVAMRGLFGVEGNALNHALRVAPHFPPWWDRARVRQFHFGGSVLDVEFAREPAAWVVRVASNQDQTVCLGTTTEVLDTPCSARPSKVHELRVPVPPVEIGNDTALPVQGSRTRQLKILSAGGDASKFTVEIEGEGGSTHDLRVRVNRAGATVEGAEIVGDRLRVALPSGDGYQHKVVTFTWR
jgi:hypothetical protein